jgi:hypothetical protein
MMIVNFTKEQIDFVKHCGEHFEVLTGSRGHSKTKQIIEQLQQENARLKDKLNKINDLLNEPIFEYDNIPCNIENEIIQLKDILKGN